MALNKKQKKQMDVARKKLSNLQQLLSAAKKQLDDPAEVESLEKQIQEVELQIEAIKNG
ncbi:MAG: hypothetical protein Tsb009_11470 [Planctomycetaceae bacterium]